jgi:hypothetical protein
MGIFDRSSNKNTQTMTAEEDLKSLLNRKEHKETARYAKYIAPLAVKKMKTF